MRVAIINYGMGNLGSVTRAFAALNAETFIAEQPAQLLEADKMVLPGVGSFASGMANLAACDWIEAVRSQVSCGKPLLGICLGMQLLAEQGTEGGETEGLGLIRGKVERLDVLGCGLRIPHVGWNAIELRSGSVDLFAGISSGTDFYFVHSFAFCAPAEVVLAYSNYGIPVTAAVGRGNVFGTQFHPEKSSKAGFKVLRNYLDFKPC
jgi:imidazole glycerol-phosphate synthase subunit HisH